MRIMLIVDIKDLEGIEPEGHFGGLTTAWVINSESAKHFTIQLSRAPVGSGAYLHSHEASEQIFFMLQGNLTMSTADGESVSLGPGMAAFFSPGEAHATENEGTEEVLSLVITSPPLP